MGMNPAAHLVHGLLINVSPRRFAKSVLGRELTKKEQQLVDDCLETEVLEAMVKGLGLELTVAQVNDGGDSTYAIGGIAVCQLTYVGNKEVTSVPWMTIEQSERCRDVHTKLTAAVTDDFGSPPSKIAVWLCADFN